MKKSTIKWVLFWVMSSITVLSAIGGSTGLQLLPLVGFIGLAYLDLKSIIRKYTVHILVLAVLMVITNIVVTDPSWIDVIMWVLVVIAWM